MCEEGVREGRGRGREGEGMSFPTRNRQEGEAHDACAHMSFIFGEDSTQSSSVVLCRHRSMQAQDRQEIDKLRQLAITQSLHFFFFGISSSTKPYILRRGRLETDHPAVLSKTLHVRRKSAHLRLLEEGANQLLRARVPELLLHHLPLSLPTCTIWCRVVRKRHMTLQVKHVQISG